MRFSPLSSGLRNFSFWYVGAVCEQRQHRGVVGALRVQRERAEVALAKLHLHERVGERAEAHAAVLRRNERAPESLGAGLRAQLAEHFLVGAVLQLLLGRDAFVLHELADAARGLPALLPGSRNRWP